MTTGREQKSENIREGDLWAWSVSFVVTFGLHVGIVLFASLAAALGLYALTASFANLPIDQNILLWLFVVVSLTVWGMLIKVQVGWFRPHTIHGLGQVTIATSGSDRGEIAADIGAVLIGLAQIGPLVTALLTGGDIPNPMLVVTSISGGLFLAIGAGALIIRLWLRRRRHKHAPAEQNE